jgi:hypothetical protein
MRFYAFGNYYLSSLQQGVQALHVITEMSMKARHKGRSYWQQYSQWAENHRTAILLNGGNTGNLCELLSFFELSENPYLFSGFCEDAQSLNGAVTSVGIILPDVIYETAAAIRQRTLFNTDSVSSYLTFNSSELRSINETEKLKTLSTFYNNTATPWQTRMIDKLQRYSLAN